MAVMVNINAVKVDVIQVSLYVIIIDWKLTGYIENCGRLYS